MTGIVPTRSAVVGDLVSGFVAQHTRRGLGWGTRVHVGRVDHRYGPTGSLVHVVALCGRRGRLEPGRPSDGMCVTCRGVAEREGIVLPPAV